MKEIHMRKSLVKKYSLYDITTTFLKFNFSLLIKKMNGRSKLYDRRIFIYLRNIIYINVLHIVNRRVNVILVSRYAWELSCI